MFQFNLHKRPYLAIRKSFTIHKKLKLEVIDISDEEGADIND